MKMGEKGTQIQNNFGSAHNLFFALEKTDKIYY